ncbi:MAG: peptidase M56, partial [Clostridiales bacterium]|nr:peptidase M56 [Clostridiales bacterium]
MLEKIFLQILNMSFTAGFVIILVLIARLFLKKAPKILSYALWGVILFRLICPFSFESMFSLLPIKSNPIPLDIV